MKGIQNKTTLLFAAGILAASLSFGQDLKQAMQLTDDEQFEKADKAFKGLINSKPDNGDFYFYEGENFFMWGKLDSAQAAYEKGIKMNPMDALNYVGLGKMKLNVGNTQEANDNFYKAKTISKQKDATVLMKIGVAYTVVNTQYRDLKGAIDILNQAILLDSKNPEIYLALGDAQWALNPTNASDAINSYEKALQLNSKFVKAILREGMVWQNAANYDLSYQKYQQATQVDSTFAPAYRQKAEMLAAAQRFDDAVGQYKKYLALNNSLSARTRYAKFLYLDKKYAESISEIQKILMQDSSDIYLYRILGYCQYETKDYKNGVNSIAKFFKKAAASPSTKMISSDYTYYGRLLSKNGQDSLAVDKLNQGANMLLSTGNQGDAADIYNQIATIYYLDNNCTLAVVYFKKRLQITQNDVNTYYFMGKASYDCKKYQAADSAFSQVISLRNDLLIGYQWKAYSDIAIDSTCETGFAIPACNQYIQKVGNDTVKNKEGLVTCFNYLALCTYSKKDVPGAKMWFKRIQGLDPANKQAQLFFDNLNRPAPQKKGK